MARSSHARLPCRRARSMARRKHAWRPPGPSRSPDSASSSSPPGGELGFLKAVVVLFGRRQRFIEHAVRVREAPGLRVGVAQHAEVVRDPQSRPVARKACSPSSSSGSAASIRPCRSIPAPLWRAPECLPELEAVLGGNGDFFFRRPLNLGSAAAVVIETRREVDGMRHAEGMADRAGELTSVRGPSPSPGPGNQGATAPVRDSTDG